MVPFHQRHAWRIANIFLKKELYHFTLCEWKVSLWIMKNKMHAHTYIQSYAHVYTHTYTHTHIHTHTHTNTHAHTRTHTHTHSHTHTRMHTQTYACTWACARVPRHTKYSFMMGCQSLWNHLPDTVKELFKQILKLVVFSQSFERLVFLNFVTIPSSLFDLFVVN